MRSYLSLPLTLFILALCIAPSHAQTSEDQNASPITEENIPGELASDPNEITVTQFAEFGNPVYPVDFEHFSYVNPDAPKGGDLRLNAVGSFDTLNGLPLGGEAPRSLGLLYQSLMTGSQDDLYGMYPLIAEAVTYPADLDWAIFHINPQAVWHDGTPITAQDVVWTFEQIQAVGNPFLRQNYQNIEEAIVLDDQRVKFTFVSQDDTQNGISLKPLTVAASMTILPRHWWQEAGRDISRPSLEAPLGSGPYRLTQVDAGNQLVYERVVDHWAEDLPVNRGLYNFDRIIYNYFRDRDIAFEAFKAGEADFRHEFTSRNWATGYDNLPALDDGRLIKEEIPVSDFRGMQGFFFNLRRAPFDDIHVRQAINLLFDFEWTNENVFFGLYTRMESYFPGSEYAAFGLVEGREAEILAQYRENLPEALFSTAFSLPSTDGSGQIRREMREALALFEQAGWSLQDGQLLHRESGEQLSFEILIQGPTFERVVQPFIRNLERVGIDASLRIVDSAQFRQRYEEFDFDLISFAWSFYPPPGELLASYFGSEAAHTEGSANIPGIAHPVVDGLLEHIIATAYLEEKIVATKALDRVLLWQYYVIPHWFKQDYWVAYWDVFGRPEEDPPFNFGAPNSIGFQPSWWARTTPQTP